MDLNKVLEKELDDKLVVGKLYEIGSGEDGWIGKYLEKNFFNGYIFEDEETIYVYGSWYLAKVGIKEVPEEKSDKENTITLTGRSVADIENNIKQKVLVEVDILIGKFRNLYRESTVVAKWESFDLCGKLAQELKEKINGL